MNGQTHEQFAIGFAVTSAMVMRAASLTELNKYSCVVIGLPFVLAGAKFPDYDIKWDSIGDKNMIKFAINKLITLTGGKHRSRHTHSVDIAIIALILGIGINSILYNKRLITYMDSSIINLTVVNFVLGWISHLVCDMLNPSGIYLTAFYPKIKLHIVPKKILWIDCGTGGVWEGLVYKVAWVLNIILVLTLIFTKI